MTPKEKAEELINKFKKSMEEADMYGFYNEATKQCALIAVNEIIEVAYWNSVKEYYQEVKQEIEKL
jgi:hypothetical protein